MGGKDDVNELNVCGPVRSSWSGKHSRGSTTRPYGAKDSSLSQCLKGDSHAGESSILRSVVLCEDIDGDMEDVKESDNLEHHSPASPSAEETSGPVPFPKVAAQEEFKRRCGGQASGGGAATSFIRRLMVPPHRLSPLRKHWEEIVQPLVEHMKLLVRMNVKRRCVELKMSPKTPEISYLQKGADFVRSFLLGFEIPDGLALLRLDDLFLESFEIKDVKRLVGDHLSRCIGRISGKEGKTKFAIENATRTRIVLADSHIHILGAFQNIKLARDSICALILGSPAGKVYNRLRTVSRRLQERL